MLIQMMAHLNWENMCMSILELFWGGNIEIADFVIIGANSVVVKSILEPGVIVAGVPARIIRKLSSSEMERMKKKAYIIS